VMVPNAGHVLPTRRTSPGGVGTYADGLEELVEADAEVVEVPRLIGVGEALSCVVETALDLSCL
jgi:hypothetical protein